MKLEHIGIAVKDLQQANLCYEKLLGIAPYKMESVTSEGVNTSFFQTGESKLELLEATHSLSPVARFIDKKGEQDDILLSFLALLRNFKPSIFLKF